MSHCTPEEKLLRENRPLILAMEMIGWLHMAGKASENFLKNPENQSFKKWYKQLDQCLWTSFENKIRPLYKPMDKGGKEPELRKFFEDFQGKNNSLLGLLQAGHGITSGIEKNLPKDTSKYLSQDITHMWLSTAFGHPIRNLLVNKPYVLTAQGWTNFLKNIEELIKDLINLISTNNPDDCSNWRYWREKAIGTNGFLRQAFTTTLAETRLPNNDVTLWDQSYVAASLFKSAVAGAVLEGNKFKWRDLKDNNWKLKQETKWRLLTVGFGSDYYTSRAVRIGDWTGIYLDIQDFFEEVRQLIEVDLALGNLLYKDTQLFIFSFPEISNFKILSERLQERIQEFSETKDFETPPYCNIFNCSSRSLIKIVDEIKKARKQLTIPVHQQWEIHKNKEKKGNVCPVCQVRLNGNSEKKDKPCEVCRERRHHRLNAWLDKDKSDLDTIWIPELADDNDRVALLTFSFDLEHWLDGLKVDSLRAQAIREWIRNNQKESSSLKGRIPFISLKQHIYEEIKRGNCCDSDVMKNIQQPFECEKNCKKFFENVIQDRSNSPKWDDLDNNERAHWLTHQLLRKHPSPGRVYRFWRTTETFFDELLQKFRETAAVHENRWRVKRLVIKDSSASSKLNSNTYYEGRFNDKSINLLYRKNEDNFITIFNLARVLKDNDDFSTIFKKGKTLDLTTDDESGSITITINSVDDQNVGPLGVYHPIIPIEQSPERFCILVPLSAATDCVNQAIEKWQTEFARVWDRMPLQVGIVAFPQKSPIQGIMEAARNMEDALAEKTETWRIETLKLCGDCVALSLEREKDKETELQTVPVRLSDDRAPDGRRADVFYPYCQVEDQAVRFSLDFQHPNGEVYRHVEELRIGDGIIVSPARFAMTFMDSSAERFEPVKTYYLSDWSKMQAIWKLLTDVSPSKTALRGVWQLLVEHRERWQNPDGESVTEDEKTVWLNFARSLFSDRLSVQGSALETLVEATRTGLLEMSLFWHFTVLKEGIRE